MIANSIGYLIQLLLLLFLCINDAKSQEYNRLPFNDVEFPDLSMSLNIVRQKTVVLDLKLNVTNFTHTTQLSANLSDLNLVSETKRLDGENVLTVNGRVSNTLSNYLHLDINRSNAKFYANPYSTQKVYNWTVNCHNYSHYADIKYDGQSLELDSNTKLLGTSVAKISTYLTPFKGKESRLSIATIKYKVSAKYEPRKLVDVSFDVRSYSHRTRIEYEYPFINFHSKTRLFERLLYNVTWNFSRRSGSFVHLQIDTPKLDALLAVSGVSQETKSLMVALNFSRVNHVSEVRLFDNKYSFRSASSYRHEFLGEQKTFNYRLNFRQLPAMYMRKLSKLLGSLYEIDNREPHQNVTEFPHLEFIFDINESHKYGFNVTLEPIRLKYETTPDECRTLSAIRVAYPTFSLYWNYFRFTFYDTDIDMTLERRLSGCYSRLTAATANAVIATVIDDSSGFPLIHNADYQLLFNRKNAETVNEAFEIYYNFKSLIDRHIGDIRVGKFFEINMPYARVNLLSIPREIKYIQSNDENENATYVFGFRVDNEQRPNNLTIKLIKIDALNETSVTRIDWQRQMSAPGYRALTDTIVYSMANRTPFSFRLGNIAQWLLDLLCPRRNCSRDKQFTGIRCCRY